MKGLAMLLIFLQLLLLPLASCTDLPQIFSFLSLCTPLTLPNHSNHLTAFTKPDRFADSARFASHNHVEIFPAQTLLNLLSKFPFTAIRRGNSICSGRKRHGGPFLGRLAFELQLHGGEAEDGKIDFTQPCLMAVRRKSTVRDKQALEEAFERYRESNQRILHCLLKELEREQEQENVKCDAIEVSLLLMDVARVVFAYPQGFPVELFGMQGLNAEVVHFGMTLMYEYYKARE